jgi:hypothetical protein
VADDHRPLATTGGGALARTLPRGRGMLRDVDRLPIEAAIDLAALAWASRGLSAVTAVADLSLLTERVVAVAQQPQSDAGQTAALAAALLEAIPPASSLPRAALADVRRLSLLAAGGGHGLQRAVALVVSGHPAAGAHVADALRPLLADDAQREAVWRHAVEELGRVRTQWRAWDPAGGRDSLTGALIADALDRSDPDAALRAARAWPPTRTPLLALLAALLQAGRREDASEVVGWYRPGTALHEAGRQLIDVASD